MGISDKQHQEFLPFSADFRCLGREIRPAATGNLYPFRLFSAVWVEISQKQARESLPFSADFHCLGRDMRTATMGISTFLADFRRLGRENKPHPVKFITMPMKRGFADKSTETQINIT
ncbi:MAG: hypothetical protein BHV86_03675 [Eshraghiella crossota]|nr:MAG: hypothetical protein BHV86_03675 [Butyrivibrio crossotus]